MLEIDPDNGYAAAHLGFVKYVYERDAAGGAPLLVQGLNSGDDRVTRDNRFYSKAGDALYRIGQKEQVLSYNIYITYNTYNIYIYMYIYIYIYIYLYI